MAPLFAGRTTVGPDQVDKASGGQRQRGDCPRVPATKGFLVAQRNGIWGRAVEVPGLGALNIGGTAGVNSVSCPSAGNCVAGGSFEDGSSRGQGYVVGESGGVWGKAREIPGLAALSVGGGAIVWSVSCSSAGNCGTGGRHVDGQGRTQAFVASEQAGVWGKALEVPGIGSLNNAGFAEINSVSCPTAQNCGAGGRYADKSRGMLGFVVSRRLGTWGTAREVPGLGAPSYQSEAQTMSVSCPSAGYCGAGGYYWGGAFVVSRQNGLWGTARTLPPASDAQINSVSCPSTGNCAAGGYYGLGNNIYSASLINELNGAWGKPRAVPGIGTLHAGGDAEIMSVSCPTAGGCAAAGYYADAAYHKQPFVVNQNNGAWGIAIEVPGIASLNADGVSWINSISCASAGQCAAGGRYMDQAGHYQAFVVSQT